MTEEEWFAHEDPRFLFADAYPISSDRRMRLFTIACCRQAWHLLTDSRSRQAVDAAEQFADSLLSGDELQRFQEQARRPKSELSHRANTLLAEARGKFRRHVLEAFSLAGAAEAAELAAGEVVEVYPYPWAVDCGGGPYDAQSIGATIGAYEDVFRDKAHLLRDIFGNPFRPVALDPAWRTETAVGMARGIYDDRAFERMPILADALQDAGCEHPDILTHCREPGVHVRGCWVVDLVLGK